MTGRVEGKVGIVTGAAAGMGTAHALTLAREGAYVAAVDICRDQPLSAVPSGRDEELDKLVQDNFKASKLVRYDETVDLIETAYWVEIEKSDDLQQFKNKLTISNSNIRVSFVDNNSF